MNKASLTASASTSQVNGYGGSAVGADRSHSHEGKDALASLSHWILNARWWVLSVALLITLSSAVGLQFLGLTTDNRVFFGPGNPELLAFEAFEKTYTQSNGVLVVFAPKDKDAFSRDTLSAIESFTESAWKLPFASRVDSLTNFSHSYASEESLVVEELVRSAEQLSPTERQRVRDIALSEPLLVNRLVSSSGEVAAAGINFLLPEDDTHAPDKIVAELRGQVDEINSRFPDIEVYLTGDIVLGAAVGEATDDDVSLLIPLMFVLIFVVIGLLLRSLTITLAAFAVIVFAALTAMGIAGWLGYLLNPGSAIAPTIILTIAVADSVHIVSNMLEAMRRGLDKRSAIMESLRINALPVFLTSLTTTIGFLTLNFSDSPPFNDLGNLVAIGVVAAFVYSMTVLPALLMLLPIKLRAVRQNTRCVERLAERVVHWRKWLLVFMVALVAVLAMGLPRIVLTDNWIEYFDERYTFRTDSDFITEHLSGIENVEYSLPAAGPEGISDPVYLATLESFAAWLRGQPKVNHVYSLSDIIKRLNKNMHGDNPLEYRLPDSAEEAAQFLLMYEMSLAYGQDLNDRIDVSRSHTRLTVTGDFTSIELRELETRAQSWLQSNAPEYMFTAPTGMSTLFAHISERNIQTMLFGSMLLLAFISLILAFALKSLKYGLISLVPNLVPAVMAVGLWGWIRPELGMAVAVVGAMTLGIIVDDTIHFLVKYLKARRELGTDSKAAVAYVFRVVGEPLYITTVSLLIGFGVLGFSGFQVNWAMGILSAMTIGFALVADFFLLPPLLLLLDKDQAGSTPQSAN